MARGIHRRVIGWSLYELEVGKDYVATVALKGSSGRRLWEWERLREVCGEQESSPKGGDFHERYVDVKG